MHTNIVYIHAGHGPFSHLFEEVIKEVCPKMVRSVSTHAAIIILFNSYIIGSFTRDAFQADFQEASSGQSYCTGDVCSTLWTY